MTPAVDHTPDTPDTLERARRERDALLMLARDMAEGAPSTRHLLRKLAETAQAFTSSEGACVLQLRDDAFHIASPTGIAQPYDQQTFHIMPAPSLFREALSSRTVLITNDGLRDPRVDPRFRDALQLRHVAVAPIVVGERVDGLLIVLNSEQAHGYSALDAAFLQRLADFSAVALRDAELLQRAELARVEAQRQATDAATAARRSDVLARTATALSSAGTPDAVYARIGEIVVDRLGAAGFSIYAVNVQTTTASLAYQTGVGMVDPTVAAADFWDTRGADVVRTGRPMFVDDVVNGSEAELRLTARLRDAGLAGLALLPLHLSGQVVGLMSIRFVSPREHDETEHTFLEAFAAQVALALRNARHLHELSDRARRLTTLAQAQQRLAGTLDRSQLPAAILDAVALMLPNASYELLESDDAGAWTRVCAHAGREIGVACTDVLSIPMHAEHLPPRLIRVRTDRPSGFDAQDADLVAILARHAMQAYETAHLFAAQGLERQRAEAAADIARATLNSGGVASACRAILEVLDRVAVSSGKAIGVARARDGRVEYVAARGSLAAFVGHRPAGVRGVLGLTPMGTPLVLENLQRDAPDDARHFAPEERALVLPLMARERALGVLLVSTGHDAPLTSESRAALEHLAVSVALAIDALLLDEEERQARERERTLATALTTLDHPVFILENDTIRYANPAASREYGWSPSELLERSFSELVVVGAALRARNSDGAYGDGNYRPDESDDLDLPAEHRHRRRDGSEFVATVTASALRAEGGGEHGTVVSVRDVTHERAVAEQLRHSEKMVALGELVAGVAHEINNPLTGISAFAELLLEEDLPEEQRESVQLIKRESTRATQVIRDLLLFARKSETEVGAVDVNALIEQTLRLRAYVLRSDGIDVVCDLDSSAPMVQGDAQRLQQVVLNFITNAEHAMIGLPTRRLTVCTRRIGDRVRISVGDTGRGMTPEVQRRLFEPFFTTKPPGVGTGLGLSVSYGIVQRHGGTLDVRSTEDDGTTMLMTLPAHAHHG